METSKYDTCYETVQKAEQIEQVHEFQYLGSVLSEDAYCSQEIKSVRRCSQEI